jgi:hypothetical protein
MAKDPAVLFYTQDFLVGTITMTNEQRGKYITLLCLQHQKQKLTLKDLKMYLTDEDIEVAEKFPIQSDGYYYNLRMFEEANKRKNYTESRRNNRKKKDDVDISLLSKSYVNRMENENVNEDVNVNVNKIVNENLNEIINTNTRQEFLSKIASDTMKLKPSEKELAELDKLY